MSLPNIVRTAPRMLQINYRLAHYAPSVLEIWFLIFWWFSRRNPDAFLKMSIQQSNPTDQEILVQPETSLILEHVWKENLRRDSRGYVQDVEILMDDWGFRLSDIKQEVYLWQGEGDANTPVSWARYMADELPHCKATFFPDEGHFALFTHWIEIIAALVNPRNSHHF